MACGATAAEKSPFLDIVVRRLTIATTDDAIQCVHSYG
jgi:hypothetical protein